MKLKVANIKDKNNIAAVYVESSLKLPDSAQSFIFCSML